MTQVPNIKSALDVTQEIIKTDYINEEMHATPGFPLYRAADKEITRQVDAGERSVLYDRDHTRAILRLLTEAAEAGVPEWKRTSSGDFQRSFGTRQPWERESEADKAEWLLKQLGIDPVRAGNDLLIGADDYKIIKDASKGLRVGLTGHLPS